MSLRTFILGLTASFTIAWLAVVVVPFFKMRNLEPMALPGADDTAGLYFPKRTGRIVNGAEIYAANGCYLCHTQLVRPTYAGNDMFHKDWGGLTADPERGDTRRETNADDFLGEAYAQIGVTRMGPDLANFGRRLEAEYLEEGQTPEQWIYAHLYNPRNIAKRWQSTCPPHPFLFDKKRVQGQESDQALDVKTCAGYEVVPGEQAKALASYLMSLKKDHKVPAALDFAPGKKEVK